MRIGMVSKFPEEKDGIAIYSENLCNALGSVARIGDLGSTKADYRINFKSLSLGKRLAEIIRKEKLDILHIQYIAAGEYFGKYTLNIPVILALKQKVPVVVTLHEVQYNCSSMRQKILCHLEKTIVRRASAIITHTPLQAEFVNRKYKEKKATCVYMGVSDSKRLAKKGKKILFFGMINEGKGVEYLIEAMKNLPDYKLEVVGKAINAEYAEKLRGAASGMKNTSVKLGWVSEKEKKNYLSDANIMALPYVWAPYQSAVATDAISYGIPIIVTKIGGTWELVSDSGSGEVIEPRSTKQIAEAAKKIHSGYSAYLQGIKKYRKNTQWKKVAARTIEVYKRLVKGR